MLPCWRGINGGSNYTHEVLLYYITDSLQFGGDQSERSRRLLDNIQVAARCGVDFIQLRELHLPSNQIEKLATEAAGRVHAAETNTKLLINSRVDVAIASGADGVHLRSGESEVSASEARNIFHKAGLPSATVTVSCHTLHDVCFAEAHGADFAVFGPVFGKVISGSTVEIKELPGVGLAKLQEVCAREAAASSRMPLLALGGVTLEKAAECMNHGAAGVAAIRLFQPQDLGKLEGIVEALRKQSIRTAEVPRRRHPYQS
jgi:thiamine-phosphate pyrophosphorylase